MAWCLRTVACIGVLMIFFQQGICVRKVFHENRSHPGIVETPGYPDHYPAQSDCSWKFEQTEGIWVVLFEDIQIPTDRNQSCVSDYLLITDAKDRRHSTKLCGTLRPEPFVSLSSRIYISFRSDEFAHGRGFRIRVLHEKSKADWTATSRDRSRAEGQTDTESNAAALSLTQESLILIGLAIVLLLGFLVLLLLALRIYRHYHYTKTRITRKQVLRHMITMDPRVTNAAFHSGVRKFSRPPPKQDDTCASKLNDGNLRVEIPKGIPDLLSMPTPENLNKSPNVYVAIIDSPAPAQVTTPNSPLDFNGCKLTTDAVKPGQLPLYYKPRDSYQEAKFMGVI